MSRFGLVKDGSVYDYVEVANIEQYTPPDGYTVVDETTASGMSSYYIADLKAKIAEERWRREEQGIMVGPYFVPTERIERGTILAMQFNAIFKPNLTINYKPKGTTETHVLNMTTVARLAECAAWYVEACFAVEKALCDLYDSGATKQQVLDAMNAAWPQTMFDLIPPT